MNFRTAVKVHFNAVGSNAPLGENSFMKSADVRRRALARFLEERGLKPTPLAQRAGVARGTLSNFLNGQTDSLNQRTLEKLAAAAHATVADLTGESTPKVDEPAKLGKLSSLGGEDIMNLQLMVQLLRQIVEQQAQTNRAIGDLAAAIRDAEGARKRKVG